MTTPPLETGQLVQLLDGRAATIRFLGPTSFASGTWVGIEFSEPLGKNDGSVQGTRYFECKAAHGMFIRAAGVATVLEEATPRPMKHGDAGARDSRNTGAQAEAVKRVKGRESAVGRVGAGASRRGPAPLDVGAKRRETLNASSPTPAARKGQTSDRNSRAESGTTGSEAGSERGSIGQGSAVASGAASRSVSQLSIARGRPPSTTFVTDNVPQSVSTSSEASFASFSTRSDGGLRSVKQSDGMFAQDTKQQYVPNHEDTASGKDEMAVRPSSVTPSWLDTASESSETHVHELESRRVPRGPPKAALGTRVPRSQVQDLEAKIRILERKRLEDREKLKKLGHLNSEKERLENIIQKLQAKFQPQQQELVNLRRKLKNSEGTSMDIEVLQAEHDAALEMATLDREIAEQTAEALRTEVDALKQRAEELQLDVEILREENQELGREMSPEERTSQGWLQMEKSNERLRDALSRLREITQSQELELKTQISGLERDLRQMGDIKGQYQAMQEKLSQSDEIIEDLRQQLEVAASSEEMLERLTDDNLALNEQIGDLKTSLEDLEDLKELNDELEQNHVAAEKQLQDELDYKDAVLGEQARHAHQQKVQLADYEQTISKFRDLVTNLQSHLEDLKTSKQITEAEAEELTTRSNAMADLNLRLQSTAAKSQADRFNTELQKADAEEAVEHLRIVQLFLVDATNIDRSAIIAYFRFKQVAFRARLLQSALNDQLQTSGAMTIQFADPFDVCEATGVLHWMSATCERFVSHMSSCSLEAFAQYEGAFRDLEPVQRNLDNHIEAVRSGSLKETYLLEELKRSKAVIQHLAEIHLGDSSPHESMAGLVLYARLIHGYLQNISLSSSHIKALLTSIAQESEIDSDSIQEFTAILDKCLHQARGAPVVANKIIRALQELMERSMAFSSTTKQFFQQCEQASSDSAIHVRVLGQHLRNAIENARASDTSVVQAVSSATSTFSMENGNLLSSDNPFSALSDQLRLLTTQLSTIQSLTSDLANTAEFDPPKAPWALRAAQLHAAKQGQSDATAEIVRLRDSLSSQTMHLRLREQTLEEQSIKIELLESRMRDNVSKAARISELETLLENSQAETISLESALDVSVQDLATAKAERDEFKRFADTHKASNQNGAGANDRSNANAGDLLSLRREIEGLQGAVRYLREDNWQARPFEKDWEWLTEPLDKNAPDSNRVEREQAAKEADDVFSGLLDLVSRAKVVDLSTLPKENRLAWRPAKEKASWQVARHAEEWEKWVSKRDKALRRGTEITEKKRAR